MSKVSEATGVDIDANAAAEAAARAAVEAAEAAVRAASAEAARVAAAIQAAVDAAAAEAARVAAAAEAAAKAAAAEAARIHSVAEDAAKALLSQVADGLTSINIDGVGTDIGQVVEDFQDITKTVSDVISIGINSYKTITFDSAVEALNGLKDIADGIHDGNLAGIANGIIRTAFAPTHSDLDALGNALAVVSPQNAAAIHEFVDQTKDNLDHYGPYVFDVVTGIPVGATLNAMKAVGTVENLGKPQGLLIAAISAASWFAPGVGSGIANGLTTQAATEAVKQEITKRVVAAVVDEVAKETGLPVGVISSAMSGDWQGATKAALIKVAQDEGIDLAIVDHIMAGNWDQVGTDALMMAARKNGLPESFITDLMNGDAEQAAKSVAIYYLSKSSNIPIDFVTDVITNGFSTETLMNATTSAFMSAATKEGIPTDIAAALINGSLPDSFKKSLDNLTGDALVQAKSDWKAHAQEALELVAKNNGVPVEITRSIMAGDWGDTGKRVLMSAAASNGVDVDVVSKIANGEWGVAAQSAMSDALTNVGLSTTEASSLLTDIKNNDWTNVSESLLVVGAQQAGLPVDIAANAVNGNLQALATSVLKDAAVKNGLSVNDVQYYVSVWSDEGQKILLDAAMNQGLSNKVIDALQDSDWTKASEAILTDLTGKMGLPADFTTQLLKGNLQAAAENTLLNGIVTNAVQATVQKLATDAHIPQDLSQSLLSGDWGSVAQTAAKTAGVSTDVAQSLLSEQWGKVAKNIVNAAIDKSTLPDNLISAFTRGDWTGASTTIISDVTSKVGLSATTENYIATGQLDAAAKSILIDAAAKSGIQSDSASDIINNWSSANKDTLLATLANSGLSSSVIGKLSEGNWTGAATAFLHDMVAESGITDAWADKVASGDLIAAAKSVLLDVATKVPAIQTAVNQSNITVNFAWDVVNGYWGEDAKKGLLSPSKTQLPASEIARYIMAGQWGDAAKAALVDASLKNGVPEKVINAVMNGDWGSAAQTALFQTATNNGMSADMASDVIAGKWGKAGKTALQETAVHNGIPVDKVTDVMSGLGDSATKNRVIEAVTKMASTSTVAEDIFNSNWGQDALDSLSNMALQKGLSSNSFQEIQQGNWGNTGKVFLVDLFNWQEPSTAITLAKTSSADNIIGGYGDDNLTGGAGQDILYGESGNDTISGGRDSDTLIGGDGMDRFVFNNAPSPTNIDTIADFTHGTDKIVLSAGVFKALTPYIGKTVSFGSTVSYFSSTGSLFYDPDGTGVKPKVQIAQLGTATHPNISVEDFIITPDPLANMPSRPTFAHTGLAGVYSELALLAYKAYDDPLATRSQEAQTDAAYLQPEIQTLASATDLVPGTAWKPLTEAILGKPDQGNLSDSGVYINDNAAAWVGAAVIDGKRTITLAYRGTDDTQDYSDYLPSINAHYDKLRDFSESVLQFAEDNHFEQIFVTGHSLGGAMAQVFMEDHPAGKDVNIDGKTIQIIGATYGSPGANFDDIGSDSRLTQFAHTRDIVPALGLNSDPALLITAAASSLGSLSLAAVLGALEVGAATTQAVTDKQGYFSYTGKQAVWLDTPLNNLVDTLQEHAMLTYLSDVWRLENAGLLIDQDKQIILGYSQNIPNTGENRIIGESFATNQNKVLMGSNQIDEMIGGTGNDSLYGLSGNDTINGNAGIDLLVGGLGNDVYVVNNSGDKVVETSALATEIDSITTSVNYTLSANVENLRLAGGKVISGTGNGLNNIFYVNSSNNIVDGSAGTDTVSYINGATTGVNVSLASTTAQATGGSGSDTLLNIENLVGSNYNDRFIGNASNNVLDGGLGIDTMIGGDGSDAYFVRDIGDVVTETNATASTGGTDLINSYLTAYTLGANVENGRILATGSASLVGNDLNNLLYTNTSNNVLNGGGATDTVSYFYGASAGVTVSLMIATAQATGGSGSDTLLNIENLVGSNYNDTLSGNSAGNTINGGLGNDVITCGSGKDTCFFNTVLGANNIDRLTDFNPIDDTIQLENAIFTKFITNGAIANDSFRMSTIAMDVNDYLIYNSTTGALFYDTDGNGVTASQQFAILPIGLNITTADFIVV